MQKVLYLIFLPVSLFAQNLVPNPGFEGYSQLPCDLNQFKIQEEVNQWIQPLNTSTDYWNTLSADSCLLNPLNFNSSPKNGHGMIGLISAHTVNDYPDEYKEYIEAPVNDKLKVGKFYYGEFFTMAKDATKDGRLLSNNLGIAFSDSIIFYPVSNSAPDHLFLDSKIIDKSIIPNDKKWHKISGCFISDKPYTYILIGNFESIHATQFYQIRPPVGNSKSSQSYYFIDDVSLIELPYDVVPLQKSFEFCYHEDAIELNAYLNGAIDYRWHDGSRGPVFTLEKQLGREYILDGDYTVQIIFKECTYSHTFRVEYVPPLDIVNDTILCYGEEITLALQHPIGEYIWSDGSKDSVKVINEPGSYWVEAPSRCQVRDSFSVSFLDCPGFIPNVITPNGDNCNDYFLVENIENRKWSLEIFNRWGKRVYFSKDYKNNWNGTGLSTGTYYYFLHSPELNESKNGWLSLVL